jgi:hypothetical protein
MLQEVGILRSECYVSNLINARPPDNDLTRWIPGRKADVHSRHVSLKGKWVEPWVVQGYESLKKEIALVRPNIIVAFGNYALWALTGEWGITKWRGSQLHAGVDLLPPDLKRIKVIPTIHPASVLREWKQRAAVVNDLRRAASERWTDSYQNVPDYQFTIVPTFRQVQETLSWLLYTLEAGVPLWVELDLETRTGHIGCIGLSWSTTEAICIPFMQRGKPEGYWALEEETWIIWTIRRITTHSRCRIRWQNGLYDAQYIWRHWHFIPRGAQDTMISQHSIFSDLPKSLAFQASMYSQHYVYWKDESKGI